MKTIPRWTHILVGLLIGVFVYTPARDNETFVLLVQAGVVPAVALTGLWMWQQTPIRHLYRRAHTSPRLGGSTHGPNPLEEASGRTRVL